MSQRCSECQSTAASQALPFDTDQGERASTFCQQMLEHQPSSPLFRRQYSAVPLYLQGICSFTVQWMREP